MPLVHAVATGGVPTDAVHRLRAMAFPLRDAPLTPKSRSRTMR